MGTQIIEEGTGAKVFSASHMYVDSVHVDERPPGFEIQNSADGRLPMLTVTGYWNEWDYRLNYTMTFRVTGLQPLLKAVLELMLHGLQIEAVDK